MNIVIVIDRGILGWDRHKESIIDTHYSSSIELLFQYLFFILFADG